ncbi:MAG: hypothetical protein ACK5FT_00210 [Sphingomonadales bacterium]|jgi:hypothetical protein
MINLLVLVSALGIVPAKTDTLPFSGRVVAADVDVKGNVYVVDSAYRLCKINTQKNLICNSVAQFGEGVLLDADNPVEPMLFFQNSGMLLITDNNLNTTAALSLLAENNIKPGGFGRANDGMVWIFDDNSSTLKKIDRSGTVIMESLVLCAKGNKNRRAQPVFDNGRLVVLTTPQNTTLVMNMNLNILAELPEKEGVCADLNEDRLLLLNNGELLLTESFRSAKKKMPPVRRKIETTAQGNMLALRGNYQLTETASALILQTR